MNRYIKGLSRTQRSLFPESLEDFIPTDHTVRVIDAFIDMQDLLSLDFVATSTKAAGRPGYDPKDLLKLYLYGYMNRVRSSRELEKQSQRNIEVMWLINRLTPDHKTIADFRKDNAQGVRLIFRHFVTWCRAQNIIRGEWVSIDGSKFKAVNSKDRNLNKNKLNEKLNRIDKRIEQYLHDLDQADEQEIQEAINRDAIANTLEHLQQNRQCAVEQLKQLNESGDTQLSLTDPDARAIRSAQHSSVVGYNVQTAVDSEHKLIVGVDVSNEGNDRNQLYPMAKQAKTNLGEETLQVVADSGYSNEQQVADCADNGVTVAIPQASKSTNAKRELYSKADFHYDKQQDCYHCPQGQVLTYRSQSNHHGRQVKLYQSDACNLCAARSRCTTTKRTGRVIGRGIHEHLLEQAQQRYQSNPQLKVMRKSCSEHPFGTIKFIWQQGNFLMRRLENVKTEIHLSAIAYNLRRLISIEGVPTLLMKMQRCV